jgi:hypothetical protein
MYLLRDSGADSLPLFHLTPNQVATTAMYIIVEIVGFLFC